MASGMSSEVVSGVMVSGMVSDMVSGIPSWLGLYFVNHS